MKIRTVFSVFLALFLLLTSAGIVAADTATISISDGVIDSAWGSLPSVTDATGDASAGQDILKAWAVTNSATNPTEIAFRVQMNGSLDGSYGLIAQISCDGDTVYNENGVDLWIWFKGDSVAPDDPDGSWSMSYDSDDRWDTSGSPASDIEWKVNKAYVDDYTYSGKWDSCVAASNRWKINFVSMYLWSLSSPSDQLQMDLDVSSSFPVIDVTNDGIDARPTYPSGWYSTPDVQDTAGDASAGQDILKAWVATNSTNPTEIAFRVQMNGTLDSNYGLIAQISCDGDDVYNEGGVDLWIWFVGDAVAADDPDPVNSMGYNSDDRWDTSGSPAFDIEWKVNKAYVDDYTYSGKWDSCVAASNQWKINFVSIYKWALSSPSDEVQLSMTVPTVVDTTAFEAHSVQTPYLWGLGSLALLGLSLLIVRRVRRS